MKPREMLLIPMGDNDAGATTIGGYLQELLNKIWEEAERFNGKRPFGNSAWEHELYRPLIAAGVTNGTLDEDGGVKDKGDADQVVFEIIAALFGEQDAEREASLLTIVALRQEADRIESRL